MHNPISYVIILAMTTYFMAGVFYLFMSYYFLFKKRGMSDKENLKAYVKNKYHVRACRFAFTASSLAVLVTFIDKYYYLLGLAIIWTLIFLYLWRMFSKILKNIERELEKILIITNQH